MYCSGKKIFVEQELFKAKDTSKRKVMWTVQRRATKQINDIKDMDYAARLKSLKLPTLIFRRMRGDMIEVFKILTHRYDPAVADFLPLHKTVRPESTTRGNSLKLFKRDAIHVPCENSFSHRVISMWNNLPEVVVSAQNLLSDSK